ncbi:MAG: hypothetical protein M1401_17970 [Chloroflexi bacterium]|nr:hypothetical protein [Chloroflexota bacterium]
MYEAIPDSEKTARYRAFWQRAETDRPLIGTTIATMPSVRAIRGEGMVRPEDMDVHECIKELEEEWEQWRDCGGDAIWSASPVWAFPWQAAMIGCPIMRDGENVWQGHVPGDWNEMERLRFDPANPWFRRLVELTTALKEHAAGHYPVGSGLLGATPSDLMMIFRGQERLAVDLYDSPEMVAKLAERSIQFCVDLMAQLLPLADRYLGGYTGTIRYFWAPEAMLETGEDLAFMMSPAAHRRFVVPIHRAFCRHYPCNILHLHSAQLHTVPNLLDVPEIRAIEITPDYGEDLLPYLGLMGQILERKPLIVHGIMTVPEMRAMLRVLPARGLALFCRCDRPEDARGVLTALA